MVLKLTCGEQDDNTGATYIHTDGNHGGQLADASACTCCETLHAHAAKGHSGEALSNLGKRTDPAHSG